MINFNGQLQDKKETKLSINNRGYHYGDAVFETIKVVNGVILFWEDHYFRLMASMRILRMEIPMTFTLEYLEEQILKTVEINNFNKACRVKLSVFREEDGLYLPNSKDIGFFVLTEKTDNEFYQISLEGYVIELFKDHFIAPNLLSTLKTTNRVINVLGSVYAKENDYQNCLLLNTNKHVIEALNGNIFIRKGKIVATPPLSDGCINGIMRKQVMGVLNSLKDYTIEERSISPFELQKADELFLTNIMVGIQPVTKYRKKNYEISLSKTLTNLINEKFSYTKDPQEH